MEELVTFLVIGGLVGIFFLSTLIRPKKERDQQERIKQQRLKEHIKKRNEQSIIDKYKTFIINLYVEKEQYSKEQLITKIKEIYIVDSNEADNIFREIVMCGLIHDWNSGNYQKSLAFESLDKIYSGFQRFTTQLSLINFNTSHKILPRNPHVYIKVDKFLLPFIAQKYKRLGYSDYSNQANKLEFGIISKKEIEKNSKFEKDVFIYDINLYLHVQIDCVYDLVENKIIRDEELVNYFYNLGIDPDEIPRVIVGGVKPLLHDLSEHEYSLLYNEMIKNLQNNRIFNNLFVTDEKLYLNQL